MSADSVRGSKKFPPAAFERPEAHGTRRSSIIEINPPARLKPLPPGQSSRRIDSEYLTSFRSFRSFFYVFLFFLFLFVIIVSLLRTILLSRLCILCVKSIDELSFLFLSFFLFNLPIITTGAQRGHERADRSENHFIIR